MRNESVRIPFVIIFTLAAVLALILTACGDGSGADDPIIPGSTTTATEADNVAKTQSDTADEPASHGISLVYQEQSRYSTDKENVNDFLPDEEKDPEEYLNESFLADDLYINRYFVKLYETDYSEEELIEKVYPGDWRGEIPPPDHLPNPECTTIRCSEDEVPTKPYESNFLPEGAEVYIQYPYSDYRFAAAVYDTDNGKKMTILSVTCFFCHEGQAEQLINAPNDILIIDGMDFSPTMTITVGENKAPLKLLAARYYSDSTDIPQSQLDEILQGAEYFGEISSTVSKFMFVNYDYESNFLPKGTRIYTVGEEAIAVFPEPFPDEDSGRYIAAVRLFKSGSEIHSTDARKLVNGKKE